MTMIVLILFNIFFNDLPEIVFTTSLTILDQELLLFLCRVINAHFGINQQLVQLK